jgi:hypothetical protein
MFLPITSLLVTLLISYFHKNELKEQKKEEVLFIITILGMNLLMEYKMGPEFIVLIGLLGLGLIDFRANNKLKDLLFYYLGIALILCIYLFKRMYMRILLVLIIAGTIISLEMLNKEKNNTGLDAFLKGLVMLSVLLYWVENGTNIRVRYIKLWNTFNKSVVKT